MSQPKYREYDRLLWLDSDVMINPSAAPDLAEDVPEGKVGCVSDNSSPSWSEARVLRGASPSAAEIATINEKQHLERLEEERKRKYLAREEIRPLTREDRDQALRRTLLARQIPFGDLTQFNSGVIMTSPAQHWEVFEQIYNSYEDVFQPLNDNIPIIVEIGRRNLLHSIDARFNVLFGLELFEHYPFLLFPLRESEQLLRLAATSVYLRSFFLHFAGSFSYAPYVNSAVATWLDLVTLGLPDKLMFPNREVASQRFLPDTSQAPKALAQVCAKPPLPSLNYFDRYRTLPGGAQPLSDQQTILFDETLSCVGFRGRENNKGHASAMDGF